MSFACFWGLEDSGTLVGDGFEDGPVLPMRFFGEGVGLLCVMWDLQRVSRILGRGHWCCR